MSKFSKGSKWRKWDLHIHTPLSVVQNYGGEPKFEAFIDALENLPREVKVVGITDYYFIDGYEKVIKEKLEKGRLQNLEKIFPILEFRIDIFSSANKSELSKVNLHILFDLDEANIDAEIESVRKEFLGQIPVKNEKGDEKYLSSGPAAFTELAGSLQDGFAELIPEWRCVLAGLKKSAWKDKIFLFLGHKEWNNLDHGQRRKIKKKELLSNANAILSAGKVDARKTMWADELAAQMGLSPRPYLHSLDIHDFKKLGAEYECNTWIKADPTFEGLKQIIHEPKDRVFIGDRPRVLGRVEGDKTKYIKSLSVDHAGDYDGRMGEWFKNISMEFSKELVVIIGNKGSGKSAIADILSLLGDTRQQRFSFLTKEKFLSKNLAENFCAEIKWESGSSSPNKLLSERADTDCVESVRYIPQNYFEDLTNELDIKEFQSEIEKIIFNHLSDAKKLAQPDFAALRAYKAKSIERAIATLEAKVGTINKEIIALEAQKHPDHLKGIDGEIASKRREIAEQEKLLESVKSAAPKQTQSNNASKSDEAIKGLRAQKSEAEKRLGECQKRVGKIHRDREELQQIKSEVQDMDRIVSDFVESNADRAARQSLDIKKIIRWGGVDVSDIDKRLAELTKNENEIRSLLVTVDDIESGEHPDSESAKKTSLLWKIHELTERISGIQQKMSAGQRQIEDNRKRVAEIETQIKNLRGNKSDPVPGTLHFLQKQKTFVEKALDSELENARKNRVEISLAIYSQKKEILDLYNSFKDPVSELIKKEEMLGDYDVSIDSSFDMKPSFISGFLGYIDKSRRGSFYGVEEGEKRIREIINNADLGQKESICSMLNSIINNLEHDCRQNIGDDDRRNISDQITNDLEGFYSHVFSLRHLEPKYELKLGNKHLHELSPGERGILLLVFYLMLDKEHIPLVLDQPEDNLDNQSVFKSLSKFIRRAKERRQIFVVTHNPNLAVGADAEQVIYVNIDKEHGNKFSFVSGSIESKKINDKIVDILEGTMPAFVMRRLKYQGQGGS